jgi:flavodoxin
MLSKVKLHQLLRKRSGAFGSRSNGTTITNTASMTTVSDCCHLLQHKLSSSSTFVATGRRNASLPLRRTSSPLMIHRHSSVFSTTLVVQLEQIRHWSTKYHTTTTTTTTKPTSHLSWRDQPIHILYASQGGTAKLFAQELQRTLQDELCHDKNHVPVIVSCQRCCQDAIKTFVKPPTSGTMFIFIVSTFTGVGEPRDHARDFYQWIMTTTTTNTTDEENYSNNNHNILTGLEYSVFGLGNSQAYPQHFNVMGITLDERLAVLGAKRILDVVLGDESNDHMEEDVQMYMEDLLSLLRQRRNDNDNNDSPAEAELTLVDLQQGTHHVVEESFPTTTASTATATPTRQRDVGIRSSSVFRSCHSTIGGSRDQVSSSTGPFSTIGNRIINQRQHVRHFHQFLASSQRSFTTSIQQQRRRRRVKYEKYNEAQLPPQTGLGSSTLDDPLEYSGDSVEEYRAMANLSPWTPVPDSVARKIFDSASPGLDDVSCYCCCCYCYWVFALTEVSCFLWGILFCCYCFDFLSLSDTCRARIRRWTC